MGFFDFLKKKENSQYEIDKTMSELQVLLQKKEVQSALMQSQSFGTVGIGQMNYLKQVNDLIYKLSELTGKTPEEIFSDPTNLTSKKEKPISSEDEDYLNTLITWANKCNLPELKIEEHMTIAGGYHEGIPRDKKRLFNLHTLNLPNCNLVELPKEIGKLKNLKKLWLDGNNLKYLPNEICNLSSLEELYVPNNNIEKLPENIGNLTKLVEINFENNDLKYLPISMVLLKNLRKIDFRDQQHGNKISSPVIPDLILKGFFDKNVQFLEKIGCSDKNDLENLKDDLTKIYFHEVKVNISGEKVFLKDIIKEIYGFEIANNQGTWYFDIAKF